MGMNMDRTNMLNCYRFSLSLCRVFLLAVLFSGSSTAQDSVVKFEKDKRGQRIPIGYTPRSILVDTSYSYHRWFDRGYSDYTPDTTVTDRLMDAFTDDVELLIFYGTWCSDTRRELPRVMNILDTVGFPQEKVKLYAVNRSKQRGDEFARKHGLTFVPTVIFYKDGKEVGRIIEEPKLDIESDMLQILEGERAK